ncbi:MAG: Mov34/MPN/PAD-1 family protein [Candidatus Heimdallarchaeota archaeon]
MKKQSKDQLNLHDIYDDKDSDNVEYQKKPTKRKQEDIEEFDFKDVLDEVEKELKPEDQNEIYPVYILTRVVNETIRMCKDEAPNEAIGILLGYKMQHNGTKYVKVVDWVTGKSNKSGISAKFTPEGVRQYTSYIDEKYQDAEMRPKIVGIIHSHPFGHNPHFSGTDYNTFLNFPYDAEHNVFVLVDPLASYYKTYVVVKDDKGRKDLEEVDWVEYHPQ